MKRVGDELTAVSTHSRPKAAAQTWKFASPVVMVSTHSRPKAAAKFEALDVKKIQGFNTQPPEGGRSLPKKARKISRLNTVFR